MELGNMNILISVPHDGQLKPSTIRDRACDQIGNLKNDINTRKFAEVLKDELISLFLAKNGTSFFIPFTIYNNLHRSLLLIR
jgi:hypothetical protein